MTRAEADLYRKLAAIYGERYIIVPQVHLSAFLNHKIKGQNWRAAFSKINGKSVDFLMLHADTLEVAFAIELDDYTHNREDRIARDIEVNNILKNAGVPFCRLKNTLHKSPVQIGDEIKNILDNKKI